jgi:hypothetical protein
VSGLGERKLALKEFVLQARDSEMDYPILEARLRISDVPALRKIIGDAASDDPNLEHEYVLDIDELNAVAALSDHPFQPDRRLTTLTPWHFLRKVPYLIHTEFELPLMLEGRKPLAAFKDSAQWLTQHLKSYDRFVKEGHFIRRIIERGNIQEVYFALPGQEWRIDAYVQLLESSAGAWDDKRERRQGELLGYEDWQNDWWINNRKSLRST